jgi:hypothetical protein
MTFREEESKAFFFAECHCVFFIGLSPAVKQSFIRPVL